jgi:hypothetical protein
MGSLKQGSTRSSRSGLPLMICGLALTLTAVLAAEARPSLAQMRADKKLKSTLTFKVRVYNYSRLDPGTLRSAERETDSVFRSAGLEIRWIDCPLNKYQWAEYPDCHVKFGTADLRVSILTERMVARASWPRAWLAYTTDQCTADLKGCWASISSSRVRNMASIWEISFPLVLGKVMAHEIGHILLGPEHSSAGIMRASMVAGDFRPGRVTNLVFLNGQLKRLRTSVEAARMVQIAAR